jgi:succinylglutamate desuccinylase
MSDVDRGRRGTLHREIGRAGAGDGPVVVVVAGVHGNEAAGVEALERVFAQITARRIPLRGEFVGLAGNLGALAAGERYLGEDLNRMWAFDRVERLLRSSANGSGSPEAGEQRALLAALHAVFDRARGPVHLVDLHTASSRSVPFYILGDTLRNREFARRFPAPVVLGFEEHIRGTLMEYVTGLGHVAVAIEGGRHDDPAAVDHHEAAVWLALADTGCVDAGAVPDLDLHRGRLCRARGRIPTVLEIFHRHALNGDDGFRMDEGYENFHPVARGQRLAEDRRGPVFAPADGLLFLPLYQKRGQDGFFLARGVNAWWLHVSALLRRLGVPRLVTRLPGVRVHARRKDTLVVDLRIARFFADRVFHLLGYRVERRIGDALVVQRRREK